MDHSVAERCGYIYLDIEKKEHQDPYFKINSIAEILGYAGQGNSVIIMDNGDVNNIVGSQEKILRELSRISKKTDDVSNIRDLAVLNGFVFLPAINRVSICVRIQKINFVGDNEYGRTVVRTFKGLYEIPGMSPQHVIEEIDFVRQQMENK